MPDATPGSTTPPTTSEHQMTRHLNVYVIAFPILLALIWALAGLSHDTIPDSNKYSFHAPPSPYWAEWGWDRLKVGSSFAIHGWDIRILSALPAYILCLLVIAMHLNVSFRGTVARNTLDEALGLLAAFIPIYLAVCATNRLLSLFLPAKIAAAAALGTTIIIASLCMRSLARSQIPKRGTIALAAALIGLSLGLLLQYGFAFITGDRTLTELHRVLIDTPFSPGSAEYFPLFAYHYDELAFLFPILYLGGAFSDPNVLLIPVWVMSALVKISAFSLTVISVRSFKVGRWSAIALVCLIFYGALNFDPFSRVYLFDSANPVFFVLHPGRVISSLALFWTMALAFSPTMWKCHNKKFLVVISFFVAMGTTALTINVALTLVVLIVALLILNKIGDQVAERRAISGAVLLAAVGLPGIYYSFDTYSTGGGYAYLCGLSAIVAIYAIVAIARKQGTSTHELGWLPIPVIGSIAAGIAIGFLIGNLPLAWLASKVINLQAHGLLLTQSEMTSSGTSLFQAGSLSYHKWPIAHQNSFGAFSARYGSPIVLSLIAIAILWREKAQAARLPTLTLFLGLLAFLSGLFAMDFLLVDTNHADPTWDYARQFALRTRLVEGGFYATILASFSIMLARLKGAAKLVLVVGIVFFTVGPDLSGESNLVRQLIANIAYLSNLLAAR